MEVLGWSVYTWSVVVRPVGHTAKFSKVTLEATYGREMNIQFSGGHSCSQHANCTLPQNYTSVVLCDKTAHLRVAFLHRSTCVMFMPSNQLLDMPHLSGVDINSH